MEDEGEEDEGKEERLGEAGAHGEGGAGVEDRGRMGFRKSEVWRRRIGD
jgi:hypothetical protein